MENTNWPVDNVRVVWESLPGDSEVIFREFSQDDIEPSLFSPGTLVNASNFPTIPYPLLNPAEDCLDRVWTQTIIKISYQTSERLDEYD